METVWEKQFPKGKIIYSGGEPDKPWARIVAAWVGPEDNVMIAAKAPNGEVGEFFLMHVLLGTGS